MFKVLVADKISATGVELLKSKSQFEVVEAYGSSHEKICELVADADALIVRSETTVNAAVIAAAQKLKIVGRAGVGVDNIDLEASTSRGIVVVNTPAGNSIAAAELTILHVLAAFRPIVQAHASMKDGKWDRKLFSGYELKGKTISVLGYGRIGREVGIRAQAFGMKVLAYDPYLTSAKAKSLDVTSVTLTEAFQQADIITVHMPLTEETKYMIDEKAFEVMKKGVRIVNVARGGIINETALLAAVDSGKVAAAGLDVFEQEPLAADSPLRKRNNILLTPHLGASTGEAQESVGIEVAELITEALIDGVIRNAVNLPSVDAATLKSLKPFLSLGHKLGGFLQQMAPQSIHELKIIYQGKIQSLQTEFVSRSIQSGFLSKISSDANDVNAPKKMLELGVALTISKVSEECEFTDLISLEGYRDGALVASVSGTIFGRSYTPRIVSISGFSIEVPLENAFYLITNSRDKPGLTGAVGTILGTHSVNIANLSLSRAHLPPTVLEGDALAAWELDSKPSPECLQSISSHPLICSLRVIHLK